MGSNMQRQAVPLVRTEAPYVGTGMEENVARDSGEALISNVAGTVEEVSGDEIAVKEEGTNKKHRFDVLKFKRSNQATSWNQKPLVKIGVSAILPNFTSIFFIACSNICNFICTSDEDDAPSII